MLGDGAAGGENQVVEHTIDVQFRERGRHQLDYELGHPAKVISHVKGRVPRRRARPAASSSPASGSGRNHNRGGNRACPATLPAGRPTWAPPLSRDGRGGPVLAPLVRSKAGGPLRQVRQSQNAPWLVLVLEQCFSIDVDITWLQHDSLVHRFHRQATLKSVYPPARSERPPSPAQPFQCLKFSQYSAP